MEIALVYFALLALAFFFLIVRPQRRRVSTHRAFVSALKVGDDVVSTGGIYGTVRALRGEAVELEIAPGILITIARAAIAQKAYTSDIGPDDPADDLSDGDAPEIEGPANDDDDGKH